MENRFRAAVFDFDGVVADTEAIHFRSFRDLLRPFGIEVDENRYYYEYSGVGARKIMEIEIRGNADTAGFSGDEIRGLVEKRRELFVKYALESDLKPTEGLVSFLHKLHKMGIFTAIASGSRKSVIIPLLEKMGLENEFCAIVGGEEVANKKPHPETFFKAAELLGVKPEECVAFEDSNSGVESAMAAGMRVFAIKSRATGSLKHDVPIINNFKEFPISVLKGI